MLIGPAEVWGVAGMARNTLESGPARAGAGGRKPFNCRVLAACG